MGDEVGLHQILQLHAGYGHAQISGGDDGGHGEAGVCTDAECNGNAGCGDAIVAADLNQHGQDAIVQRIGGDGKTNEAAEEAKHQMQMLCKTRRQDPQAEC